MAEVKKEINWSSKELCQKNEKYNFSIYKIKQKNYQIVFTAGLSNYQQAADIASNSLSNIELYFCLPEYWDIEKNNWPIHWLNRIAQVPQKNKTSFGIGDTLPAGNPPNPLDEKFLAEYFVLLEPMLLHDELVTQHSENFKWLAVVPIFKKEFDFKLQNSTTALLKKFEVQNVTEMVDTFRLPVGRKKFMGIF